jgi:hypothetical protein
MAHSALSGGNRSNAVLSCFTTTSGSELPVL